MDSVELLGGPSDVGGIDTDDVMERLLILPILRACRDHVGNEARSALLVTVVTTKASVARATRHARNRETFAMVYLKKFQALFSKEQMCSC